MWEGSGFSRSSPAAATGGGGRVCVLRRRRGDDVGLRDRERGERERAESPPPRDRELGERRVREYRRPLSLSRPPREETADGLRELERERERLPPDGVRLRDRLRLADECGRIFRAGDGEPERELIMVAGYSL
jgi:hypothetical protein